ncbi:heterokaryon incompatibility protein-domain-containing protein [Cladorrhinum sp. PSN332]|nr:heterokaryon incompatibility protein-domain-containing protein [Cladorrhinum sp. PSN332]
MRSKIKMRLINTTTLRLEGQSLSPPASRYGVLSHTWGTTNSEVTYEEMSSGDTRAQQKSGWVKIQQACHHASELGLQYLWVDTCCIDKSNVVEITDAINSMFEWFKGSATCLVYLDDISSESSGDSIATARWFTRGWTLQELIAPPEVRFYSREWNFIGSRFTRSKEIFEITGVDPFVLGGGDIKRVCAARRMFWASRRFTTRGEDLAYCLLGIFDVNMPMQYGEGAERAFRRLQEAIIRSYGRSVDEPTSVDLSIFAWQDGFDWEGSGLDAIFDRYGGVLKFKQTSRMSGLLADSPADFERCGSVFPPLGISDERQDGCNEEAEESIWDNMSTTSTLAQSAQDDTTNTALARSIAFLRDDLELLPLFEAMIGQQRLGREGFQRTLLGVLRSLAVDLGLEARSEAEASVAIFVRKYRLLLASAVTSSFFERTRKPVALGQDVLSEFEHVESVERAVDEASEPVLTEGDPETEGGHRDLKEGPVVDVKPALLEDFLRSSKAYQQMLMTLRDLAFPSFRSRSIIVAERLFKSESAKVRGSSKYWKVVRSRMLVVISELHYSRPSSVIIETHNSVSITEWLQRKTELLTGENWNWWPLQNPRPWTSTAAGECRLGWTCSCGDIRWETVPLEFATQISSLIQVYPLDGRPAPLTCPPPARIARAPSGITINPAQFRRQASADSKLPPYDAAAVEAHQKTPQVRFVFLLTKLRTIVFDEIPSLHLNTEHFADELRRIYFRRKGLWGSWLSMYEFSHCEFGKFERYRVGGYAHRGYGLPDRQRHDYYFVPSSCEPPITPEEFKDLFQHACQRQTRKWADLLPLYQHFSSDNQVAADTVDRIPQRRYNFNERVNTREEFWGIYIRERRSAFMTLLYIVLSLSPFVGFCALYLVGIVQADLQNATAPLALSLTCLGLVFGSFIKY